MITSVIAILFGLAIEVVAGFFSVVGLTKIFSGNIEAIIAMGILLEASKPLVVVFLQNTKENLGFIIKNFLRFCLVVLIAINGIGVFGFLTNAHLVQSSGVETNISKLERIEVAKQREQLRLDRAEETLGKLDAAIDRYIELGAVTKSVSARAEQEPERLALAETIKGSEDQLDSLTTEEFEIKKEIQKLDAEIGPLKFVVELFVPKDEARDHFGTAISIFIVLLVISFQPLALTLVRSGTLVIQARRKEKEEEPWFSGASVKEEITEDPFVPEEPPTSVEEAATPETVESVLEPEEEVEDGKKEQGPSELPPVVQTSSKSDDDYELIVVKS